MKLNYLILSAAAMLTFSSVSGLVLNQPALQAAPQNAIAKSGKFVAAEHPTQGTARIINEKGKRYLEFDKTFKSDSGPDLHVILHRDATLPISGLKEQDYITIGRLQKVSGTQRYAIPDNVNLKNFRSVAVWCRMFNATFGYAPLQTATPANHNNT